MTTVSVEIGDIVEHLSQQGIEVELHLNGQSRNHVISSIAPLDKANSGQISFLSDVRFKDQLPSCQASALLIKADALALCPSTCAALLVKDPYVAYAYTAQLLYQQPSVSGIAASAVIAPGAQLAQDVSIGEHVVIADGVVLEQGVVIGAGSVIEAHSQIGAYTHIKPNVTIMHDCIIGRHCIIESGAVIGGDGFGWARDGDRWVKIPQVGRVILGDHVSVGNNSTIDRGALDDTRVDDYCIIDNLVHLAHNVRVGRGSAFAAFAGISGSTTIGKNCTFSGQTATSGHLQIADGVTLLGRAAVTHSVKKSGVYAGLPLQPVADWQKTSVNIKNINKLALKVKQLAKQADSE